MRVIKSLFIFCVIGVSHLALAGVAKEGQFLGAKTTQMPAWFKESFLDLSEDAGEAGEAGKRLMVFVHQDGCPYCNLFVTKNLADSATKKRLQNKLQVMDINMWGDREITDFDGAVSSEKEFAVRHRVQFTPTILFFDAKGKEVLRLNGYVPTADFHTALDYVEGKKEASMGYAAYVQSLQNSQAVKDGRAMVAEPDLFMQPPYALMRNAESKPLAVFFEKPNCSSCVRLHEKVLVDKTTRGLLKQMDVVQLDMTKDTPVLTPNGKKTTTKQWAADLKINFAPSIVFFNEKAEEVIRSEAVFKVFHTQSIVDYVLSGGYKKEPEFQRYLTERADHIREQGQDVDIWQ